MIDNPTSQPTNPFRTLVDQTLNWVIDLGMEGPHQIMAGNNTDEVVFPIQNG